jgi:outer membrane protein, heavy metal efflux system
MSTSCRVRQLLIPTSLWVTSLGALLVVGCRSTSSIPLAKLETTPRESRQVDDPGGPARKSANAIVLAAFADEDFQEPRQDQDAESGEVPAPRVPADTDDIEIMSEPAAAVDELPNLEAFAVSNNPTLLRLQQQANAASSKSRYVDKLPDPSIGTNIFGHAIETAAGSQRANLTLSQKIPWLDRLDAQQQQALYEAMALQQRYAAERLRVIADVRVGYYRVYVLVRQIETIEANQELLESLIEIVNARVANGVATQGDVLLGTLELSRLEEQLITLRQQVISTESGINRLLNRPSGIPIVVPKELGAPIPDWAHETLVQTADQRQPVIAAAQLQANASRWGVNVAELQRRPDFQVGAAWFFMDNNRPPSSVVDVGQDAWSLGATMTIPLDREKYDAIRDEALWKNSASRANVADVRRQFDARLLDLLEQARAASDTSGLYKETIIPQAEQTLLADEESLTDGAVEFDRVIKDFRSLLTLEFGYHRAVGQLATAIARIQEAVGIDIQPQPELQSPEIPELPPGE